jgi:glycosyltransferase involved in cell wall biosynthesis
MKVLHLASFDRWTGAAAPAFVEVEALRSAGVEACYGYVGGFSLETKIGHLPYTHPILRSGQRPDAVWKSRGTLRKLIEREQIDILHCHLSHDHWLAAVALLRESRARLVRTFHAPRPLRLDPLTRWLLRRTHGIAVNNPTLSGHTSIAGRSPVLTPPPAEPQYTPEGGNVRPTYRFLPSETVIGFIGKVSPGRGFEQALDTYALLRQQITGARMLIVGDGPYRHALMDRARQLGLEETIVWAGYHEEDLAEHFRAMDLMLFTAPGSDFGHRAIVEAISCGTPVVSYPIDGVDYILGGRDLVAEERTPSSLAALALAVLSGDRESISRRLVQRAEHFRYPETARRLITLYDDLLQRA